MIRLAICLALLSGSARAGCGSLPQCLSQLPHVGAQNLAKIGAVVAPVVIGVGALITVAHERSLAKADPEGVVVIPDENGQPRAALELVPAPRDRYYNADPPRETRRDGAFRFNDTATNVALAVGGAAVLGGIIAGIIKGHH